MVQWSKNRVEFHKNQINWKLKVPTLVQLTGRSGGGGRGVRGGSRRPALGVLCFVFAIGFLVAVGHHQVTFNPYSDGGYSFSGSIYCIFRLIGGNSSLSVHPPPLHHSTTIVGWRGMHPLSIINSNFCIFSGACELKARIYYICKFPYIFQRVFLLLEVGKILFEIFIVSAQQSFTWFAF